MHIKLFILCIISFFLTLEAQAFTHNEKLKISRNLTDNLKISGEIDHRFDGNDLFYRHFDVGLSYPIKLLGDGWSFRVHHRNIYRFNDSDTSLEKRPYAQIQKTFTTLKYGVVPELKWGIRTRQEYRIRNNGNHTARNRSRIRMQMQQPLLKVKPFISNEIFYDMDAKEFTQNRIDIGFDLPKLKGTKTSLYYKLVTEIDSGTPEHTSSLVVSFAF